MTDPLFDRSATSAAYRGSTGSAGSATSAARAEREMEDGSAGRRQATILNLLAEAGPLGMTVVELRSPRYGLGHHGQVSSALTNLHIDGKVASLKYETRGRAGVYVLPEHVMSRIVRPYESNAARRDRIRDQKTQAQGMHAQAVAMDEVAGPAAPAPAPKPKPVLTQQEIGLLDRCQAGYNRSVNLPVVTVRTESLGGLLAIIDRLARG